MLFYVGELYDSKLDTKSLIDYGFSMLCYDLNNFSLPQSDSSSITKFGGLYNALLVYTQSLLTERKNFQILLTQIQARRSLHEAGVSAVVRSVL